MQLLREQPNELAALVVATADALSIDAGFVEKDFWVIEVLRAATASVEVTAKDGTRYAVQTIFKGGTSLSRAYGLIERFSEDVDLLVSFPEVETSIKSRDTVLKSIRDNVASHLKVEALPVVATTGIKRNVRYPYPAHYGGTTGIAEGVLLEMGSRGGAFPTQQHQLRSLIANHAIDVLHEATDAWAEFESVATAVLAPERTLLEKLALLHDGVSRFPDDIARAKLLTGGRHLYDVHQLLVLLTSRPHFVPSVTRASPACAETSTNTAPAPSSVSPRDQRAATALAHWSIPKRRHMSRCVRATPVPCPLSTVRSRPSTSASTRFASTARSCKRNCSATARQQRPIR